MAKAAKAMKPEQVKPEPIPLDSPTAFNNRELSWLNFARRVLAQVHDHKLPLMERVKFAGIMGMLHDEFFMKRIGGLKRQINKKVEKFSIDGRRPMEELMACREELLDQISELARVVMDEIRPALRDARIPILDYSELTKEQKKELADYFRRSVLPILTPLAVDAEHPFPFISNLGLNLAVEINEGKKRYRFVRIKVPANRNRWVPLRVGDGFVPLEQVIAANLDQLFPKATALQAYFFRVTRGAEGDRSQQPSMDDPDAPLIPGSIIIHVTDELKARRFAGVVRLEVNTNMPEKLQDWLAEQLGASEEDIYPTENLQGICDLLKLKIEERPELHDPPHHPVTHPRLRALDRRNYNEIFDEICRGNILLHHPYHSFDTSVLHFLECAAVDPKVLAIKLTIYRTSTDSPIINALAEAARRGKQVAVLVEVTARFDEAPNIAWGELLEKEGVHVAYGVEKLKTHVKLAMVVREEEQGIRRYIHVGTGNYHTGTARNYEDLGILSCDDELSEDVAAVFNELTGSTPYHQYSKLLVAPRFMRERFVALIQREAEHAKAGRAAGIRGKMNQLQDPDIIRELYRASQAGVPIVFNVRGICCLRAGVPGLSENIRVYSVVGRFLEHGRIYRFDNNGEPEHFIGSADWMRRNLDRRVETIMPVIDPQLKRELDQILDVLETDNCSAWDLQPDNSYILRHPAEEEEPCGAQQVFIHLAREQK